MLKVRVIGLILGLVVDIRRSGVCADRHVWILQVKIHIQVNRMMSNN